MRAINVDWKSSKLTEAEIVMRVLSGEKELYEILMRRNNQKLYRVLRGYQANELELKDIMQNTYIKAYEKLEQFKLESTFSTWLIRIGINEALGHQRKETRVHNLLNQESPIAHNAPISPINPEQNIVNQEVKQYIERAIDTLDEKYRIVFIMKEVEGMSIKEVASCLDISESNVKVRLFRAKDQLKNRLLSLHLDNELFQFGLNKCDRLVDYVMERI